MAQFFAIHPEHPQPRLIKQAADIIRSGGLVALPTDSAYAIGGHLGDGDLLERIRRIRGVGDGHLFTLVCRNLAQIATYARVDNAQFRLLKSNTPGSYTFILEGTKELPRRVLQKKRKTIGLRIPDHVLVQALLSELNEPLLTSTLILPGDEEPLRDAEEIRGHLEKQLDLIIDAGVCGGDMTSVIDLTGRAPELVRAGRGALEPFAFES